LLTEQIFVSLGNIARDSFIIAVENSVDCNALVLAGQ
jgi:hypothetical protein